MTFKLRSWPDVGDVTENTVVYYSVWPQGYNIPATPIQNYDCDDHAKQCTGLIALKEKGDTWDLEDMAQDTCSIWCFEVSKQQIPKAFPFDRNWEVHHGMKDEVVE